MDSRLFLLLSLLAVGLHAAPVEIHRVIPGKIVYRCNENGHVDVTIANPGEAALTATVRVAAEWGLLQQRAIGERTVELPPGEVRTERFPWRTSAVRYGRGVRADVLVDGEIVATRREFCNVIDEWWRVHLPAGGMGREGELRRKVFDYYHIPYTEVGHSFYASENWPDGVGPFVSYRNHIFRYCSMPSVFGDHTPEPDSPTKTWYSGRGWYPFTLAKLEEDVAKCKQWGVRNGQYSQTSINGPSGFELARQYPEHIGRTATGAFMDEGYGSPDPILISGGIHQKMPEWVGVMPNTWNRETVIWGAEELANGIEMFGWDAVFFDGCGYIVKPCWSPEGQHMPNGRNPDAISARNIRLTRETIRKRFPDTFLWYNGANPGGPNPGTPGKGFWPKGNGGGWAGKLEMIGDLKSGGLKELQTSQVLDRNHVGHTWRSLYEIYLSQREGFRQTDYGRPTSDIIATGALNPMVVQRELSEAEQAKSRGQWAWCNHATSLIAASSLRLFGGGGAAFRPMLQLMTRYSEFLWHEDLEVMPKSYKHFMVDSLRETWWEDSIYMRETPEYREIVMCIVNSPDEEKAHPRIFTDPEPADDVEITLLEKHDPERFEAWAIIPYGYDAEILEPTQTKLESELIEGEVVLAVPPFHYFCMVVIRETK